MYPVLIFTQLSHLVSPCRTVHTYCNSIERRRKIGRETSSDWKVRRKRLQEARESKKKAKEKEKRPERKLKKRRLKTKRKKEEGQEQELERSKLAILADNTPPFLQHISRIVNDM
jgi:hypothetical protein